MVNFDTWVTDWDWFDRRRESVSTGEVLATWPIIFELAVYSIGIGLLLYISPL